MREFTQEIVKIEQYCPFMECEKVRLMGVNNQNMGEVVLLLVFVLYFRLWFCTLVLVTQ